MSVFEMLLPGQRRRAAAAVAAARMAPPLPPLFVVYRAGQPVADSVRYDRESAWAEFRSQWAKTPPGVRLVLKAQAKL